jgi:hypothetical protein
MGIGGIAPAMELKIAHEFCGRVPSKRGGLPSQKALNSQRGMSGHDKIKLVRQRAAAVASYFVELPALIVQVSGKGMLMPFLTLR